jgi:TolA-binding protein
VRKPSQNIYNNSPHNFTNTNGNTPQANRYENTERQNSYSSPRRQMDRNAHEDLNFLEERIIQLQHEIYQMKSTHPLKEWRMQNPSNYPFQHTLHPDSYRMRMQY